MLSMGLFLLIRKMILLSRFDAGPNAVVYGFNSHLLKFRALVEKEFTTDEVLRIIHTRVGPGPAVVEELEE